MWDRCPAYGDLQVKSGLGSGMPSLLDPFGSEKLFWTGLSSFVKSLSFFTPSTMDLSRIVLGLPKNVRLAYKC